MRISPLSLALTLAATLGAVTACTPAPITVDTPKPVPVIPAASPAAPAPSVAPAATLTGEARYFGAPLADAEVLVGTLGMSPALVGRTDAQGRFGVAAPGGTLLVVVRQGARHVATVVTQPERTVAAAGDPILVDELSAFLYMTFLPRLVAIEGIASAPPADTRLSAEGQTIFETTLAALRAVPTPLGRDAFEAGAPTLDGPLTNVNAATRAALITATPPGYIAALVSCGDQLNALIRKQVLEKGRPMPAPALLDAIQLQANGPAVAPNVFGTTSEESSGGSGGSPSNDDPNQGVGGLQFDPALTPFEDEAATPTISTENQAN